MYFNSAWFWVSAEPWGWTPYHYGRWGWSVGLGWYWIPGNTFAPAYVSWYSYGDYVGWCPLNYYNSPIYYDGYYNHDHHDHGGYYPPIQKQKTLDVANSWTFVKKNDLGMRNVKQAILNSSQVRDIHIDKAHVAPAPQKELVSYVIPKTRQYPGLVNDKRLIKQPEDIKSPVGINHREDQFVRPGSKNPHGDNQIKNPNKPRETTVVPRPHSDTQRDEIRNNKPPNKLPQFTRPTDEPQPRDRDWQFKRNETRQYHDSPFVSPYYKNRNNRYDTPNVDPRVRSYNYPERDDSERYQDVNPKYRDEARRYFERFEHKNPPNVERPDNNNAPPDRNYVPPSRSYEPPSRNYSAPPPREYKAPEVRRPDTSNHSRPNNNSNNDNKPHKPH